MDMAETFDIPVALSVIPQKLETDFADKLKNRSNIYVLQHGYSHQSHAHPHQKKIEMGGAQTLQTISAQLRSGQYRLLSAFGDQFVPVLVPPWNRIEATLIHALPELGFSGLSSMWAMHVIDGDGLLQVNTHLDPINWRHGQEFIGYGNAIGQIHQHLYARRHGFRDPREPTGVLTHHLVQNETVWRFCTNLFSMLNDHAAVRWLSAADIWGPSSRGGNR